MPTLNNALPTRHYVMSMDFTANDLQARLITREDFQPCESAFVDVRIPGSEGKLNYSFIGPGVTQSDDQYVNLLEPHGFQIGGVQLPHQHINNLHLHFTAEVFICARGEWICFWGADGQDGEVVLHAGDIISVPTWVFRGFQNTGGDDGFMFSVLGGDDTGGIIWGPEVLRKAAQTGLYLTRDNMLLDIEAGDVLPSDGRLLQPVNDADIADLRTYSVSEMLAQQVLLAAERQWQRQPFLSNVLANQQIELAPVIGYGLSQDRNTCARIMQAHGFSIDWLRASAGQQLPMHKLACKQVFINQQGCWRLNLKSIDGVTQIVLDEWGIYSLPAGVWHSLEATGEAENELLVVCAGDARKEIEWEAELIMQALQAGWTLDASGYLAKADLLPSKSASVNS